MIAAAQRAQRRLHCISLLLVNSCSCRGHTGQSGRVTAVRLILSGRPSELPDRNKIKRVGVCSDLLMTSDSEQQSNLRWLFLLLERPIRMSTGLPVEKLYTGTDPGAAFRREEFFHRANLPLDAKATHNWYDQNQITEAARSFLENAIRGDETLVIGYELSIQTKAILDALGIVYVDLWLHPVRFYDDILFALQSNDAAVHASMAEFHVPEDQFFLYADRLKVQATKGWYRKEAQIPADAACFFGQTLNDKSVCHSGAFLTVLDYKPAFEDVVSRHSTTLYQRHPYVRHGDEKVLDYLKSIRDVALSDHKTYDILAHPNLKTAVSLSSSVLHEAKYFEKDVQYFFEPVLRYDAPGEPGQFWTVCQDFVSPHFWSAILAPIMQVTPQAPIRFRDSKDKLRDMLGFYWSYGQIDKGEATRQDLVDLSKETRRNLRRAIPGDRDEMSSDAPRETRVRTVDLDDAKKRIERMAVVSFDVFETLIERPLDKPADLHLLMQAEVDRILPGRLPDFPTARREARKLAIDAAHGEEVLLSSRYAALGQEHKLTEAEARSLYELELDWEKRICAPRVAGKVLFDWAVKNEKQIILVSDTYLDRGFVETLLDRCGYSGWAELYASSEHGTLKSSGTLFDTVVGSEAVAPRDILHIGDNRHSDIERGAERGLSVFYLPSSRDLARDVSPVLSSLDALPDCAAVRATKGLVQNKISAFRGSWDALGSHALGDPGVFGYCLLGPLHFSFAAWVLRKAIEDNVEEIYFLSRDGDIVKRCYDAISGGVADAPPSRYLYASRRAVQVASIETLDDILRVMETGFSAMPLRQMLEHRLGIEAGENWDPIARRSGIANLDEEVSWKADAANLTTFLKHPEIVGAILQTARVERELLLRYYQQNGLVAEGDRKIAIVDIGHLGSLQAGLARLVPQSAVSGYYFATFKGVDQNIDQPGQTASGFYVDRLDRERSRHDYVRNTLMFELIFLNDQDSFLNFKDDAGDPIPVFLPSDGEGARRSLIKEAHSAAVQFCSDLVAILEPAHWLDAGLGPELANPFVRMIEAPGVPDCELMAGVFFENVYSGRPKNWIIHPNPRKRRESIWRQGHDVLHGRAAQPAKDRTYGVLGWRRAMTPFVAFFVGRVGGPVDREEYLADPARYFADLETEQYRKIGRALYPAAFRDGA